jgi:hypothetical protein
MAAARLRFLLVAVAAVASGWPDLARAVDGVVEINQAAANAGGVTPGDSPGFPVTLGLPGSYRLTGNLVVPFEQNGLEVLADHVLLDLNGFLIQGGSVCSGAPPTITCSGSAGVGVGGVASGTRVRNGSIAGFALSGVVLGPDATLEDLLVRGNGGGVVAGERSLIRDSQVGANEGNGIVAGADSSISASAIVGNNGVALALGVGARFGDNVISGNGGAVATGGLVLPGNACNGSTTCTTTCTDADSDAAFADCVPVDCDDSEPASFPGNPEICDAIDNDCDAEVDEGGVCTTPGVGDLVINEIMYDPEVVADLNGEWFEVINTTGAAVELLGCSIVSGPTTHVIASSLGVGAGSFAVLAINGNPGTNGGVTVDYTYSGINLANSGDDLRIDCGAVTIDQVVYDTGTFPDPVARSIQLDPSMISAVANDVGANWCESVLVLPSGDRGSPGMANTPC